MGMASPPLIKYFESQPLSSKILIPGAGQAWEAKWLYEQGFEDISVLDLSESALALAQEKFDEPSKLSWLVGDFFEHQGLYDLIMEQTFFCALDPILRADYALKMKELLKPGGRLFGLLFNFPLSDDGPPFGGSLDEYQQLFEKHFKIAHLEPSYNSIKPRSGKEIFIELIAWCIFVQIPMAMAESTEVLNHKQVSDRIARISWQIFEEFSDESKIILAGIAERGYLLAEKIHAYLGTISDLEVQISKLTFDKDRPLSSDYLLEPAMELNNANVILVDDVLKSGGTLIYGVRYFLDHPVKTMKTVVLVDRNHKRYPVKADFKGLSLSTSMKEHVSVEIENEPYSVLVS